MFEHNLKPEDSIGVKTRIASTVSWIKTSFVKILGLFFVVVSIGVVICYTISIVHTRPQRIMVTPEVLGAFTIKPPQNLQGLTYAGGDLNGQHASVVATSSANLSEPILPQLDSSIAAPNLTAGSALAYEDNGPVLYSYNPDQKVPIASLTKLMTALLVMNDSRYGQPLIITSSDLVNTNPILHLKVGDVVMPSDLVQSILVGSANDAAMTLANHFSTKDQTFLEQMNTEAKKLNMTSTHYSTPIGFDDPQNYSTARDLQKLVYAVIPILPFSKTDHAASYSFKSISTDNPTLYSVKTTSKLPDVQPNIGVLKTGFTDDAKQAMVAESNIGGHEIITIVLQSDNRDKDTSVIFNYISKAYSFK